jgi:uncharacterized membrane protein
MRINVRKGIAIIACSAIGIILTLQLDSKSLMIIPLLTNVVWLFYGMFLLTRKTPVEQKPFSIINFGIGAFIAVIATVFVISYSRNEKSKDRRQLEHKLQEIKKTSRLGCFFI